MRPDKWAKMTNEISKTRWLSLELKQTAVEIGAMIGTNKSFGI